MKYVKGESGNPAGRRKGLIDKRCIYSSMLSSTKQEVFDKALQMALEGHEQMIKLFMDRILPAPPKDNPVSLDENFAEGDLVAKCDHLTQAIAEGNITPYQANQVMAFVSSTATIDRLDRLETAVSELLERV